jgi:hypothetical protein
MKADQRRNRKEQGERKRLNKLLGLAVIGLGCR